MSCLPPHFSLPSFFTSFFFEFPSSSVGAAPLLFLVLGHTVSYSVLPQNNIVGRHENVLACGDSCFFSSAENFPSSEPDRAWVDKACSPDSESKSYLALAKEGISNNQANYKALRMVFKHELSFIHGRPCKPGTVVFARNSRRICFVLRALSRTSYLFSSLKSKAS
jgi:hypothetical protein